MPHIPLPEGLFGIVGPLMKYPETGQPMLHLAEALLRGPSPLTPGERELIAAYVSSRNECQFCTKSHASAARHLLSDEAHLVDAVCDDLDTAPISDKMRALLVIAGKVQQDGRLVADEDIARARDAGADDKAIHDTVLTAAAFCMFNRYVDGLATLEPPEDIAYVQMGADMANGGYLRERRVPAEGR